MTLGTVFIMVLGFEIAYKEIWLGGEMGGGLSDALDYVMEDNSLHHEEKLEGYPVRVNGTHLIPVVSLFFSFIFFFPPLYIPICIVCKKSLINV